MSWLQGANQSTAGMEKLHACNCIGCCEKCGMCRTDPRHAGNCDKVAEWRSQNPLLGDGSDG